MLASISLALYSTFETKNQKTFNHIASSDNPELNFHKINKDSPIPLLLNGTQSQRDSIKVLGAEIEKPIETQIRNSPPSTMLRDAYIRSFSFATTNSASSNIVSVSWNSRKASTNQVYVVKYRQGSKIAQSDMELFSVEGKNLEVSSHIFEIGDHIDNLYLSIYQLTTNGNYELIENSLVATNAN